ncbi:hypothetical protein [Mycobacteroides abscessus]|uniref:hypothetical protein n=1 Tax=Mycobacteroides abscessus TaxID=36809 RepID=UPI00092B29E1|nr:hypothetical protein [Mycobacteroides abscessus]SKS22460.1 Uncharacterised protein [Mycobacteroides abscessus subsp. abscessus]SHU80023.1 Uncharacterised protein [Mycobacteroides abscessus subsp. bolletii]SHW12484.1 Uncharacterised protein [Mycobacteroides abscessus subsp. bolletii]SHX87117.1 Uncharacterised protein [Mycobacteroides abscessus subsp. bolletii]SHY41201.1 Uncharacterised protein [Mycobacteroides abscessus subsp. bolletii]
MSNHVVVVLESTGGVWPLSTADTACAALAEHYRKPYPDGISVSARLTDRKTIFTMTGDVRYVAYMLKLLGGIDDPGVGSEITVEQRVLRVTSATITPPPPRNPQSQATTPNSGDDSYALMFDFVYKMTNLSMQGFNS